MAQVVLNSGGNCSENHTTTGVLVRPSAAAWVVVLQNSAGGVIFEASGAADETFFAPVKISSDAFNMSTATNITRVILYV